MRAPSNAELAALWERGVRLHPIDRGLLVLSAARPEVPADTLGDWPLGRRNRALAEWVCHCFGPMLEGWTSCPRCDERLEFELDARLLETAAPAGVPAPETTVEVGGDRFRLPTSRDLSLVASEPDATAGATRLLEACLVGGDDLPALSEAELEELGEQLALADPLAETLLALTCPECEHRWDERLEIAAFAWARLEARARRLLVDVHLLASAYGWNERDVLELSDPRRAFYLELVEA